MVKPTQPASWCQPWSSAQIILLIQMRCPPPAANSPPEWLQRIFVSVAATIHRRPCCRRSSPRPLHCPCWLCGTHPTLVSPVAAWLAWPGCVLLPAANFSGLCSGCSIHSKVRHKYPWRLGLSFDLFLPALVSAAPVVSTAKSLFRPISPSVQG